MMIFQLVFFQIIVFAAVIYFLKKILYGNTENAVSKLGNAYQDLLKKQADLTQKLETAEKEYQAKKEEAAGLVEKAKIQADEETRKKEDEVSKRARAEAEEIIAKANSAREDINRELEANFAKKCIDSAATLLKVIFDADTKSLLHEEMVKGFMNRTKDLDLSTVDGSLENVVVRTAAAFKKEESEKLHSMLLTKLGRPVSFHEVVEPDLIAGFALQFGKLVLDGSLATALKEAADKTKEKVAVSGD